MISVEAMKEFGFIDAIPYLMVFAITICVSVDCLRAVGFVGITKYDRELQEIYDRNFKARFYMMRMIRPVLATLIALYITLMILLLTGKNIVSLIVLASATIVIAIMMTRVHCCIAKFTKHKELVH